ncbi:MAG TPA: cytochrome c oxidase subunit 3 [Candidatus Methylacidiphilales bacterium]|nr:cytochrome c oxidase subunit 3 [Candidatus Methylacidiphilales bacterium]
MEIPYTFTARPDTGLYNGKLGIWLFLASEVMLFGALFTAYLFERIGADPGTWPTHVLVVGWGLANTIILILSSITMVYAWVALKERKFNQFRLFLGITILCGVVFLGIKSYEYYSKFVHYDCYIRADAFDKYADEFKKADVLVNEIPTQGVFGIRGHWENKADKDATFYEILPDKNFHPIGYKPASGEAGASSGGEEQTFKVDKADVWRFSALLPADGTYYAIYFTVTGLHAMHIIGGVVVMLYFLTAGSSLYRRNPEQFANRIEVTGIFWHFVDLVWITVFPILYLT